MERTFEAPARAVFDAWTSEEVIRRWWHAEEAVRSHEDSWGKAFDNLEGALTAASG
jgi:uncharacterized protein YndB with AHSA1/START domain